MAPESPSSDPMTKNDYLSKVTQGFDSVEQLWESTDNVSQIHGLDQQQATQVKTNIETAYESMREAKRILSAS